MVHWTSSRVAPPSRGARPGRRGRPSRRRLRGGTSTRRRRARRSRRRTGRRPARRRRSTPRRCGPSPARAAAVGGPDVAADPAVGPAADRRRRRSPRRRRCRPAPRSARGDRRSERLTRSPSSGRTPRGSGDHQASGPGPAQRHREQPDAVGGEDRARLEVGADADDAVLVGRLAPAGTPTDSAAARSADSRR